DLLEVEAERDVAAVAEAPRALQRVVPVRAATLAREGPAPVLTAAVLLADVGEHEAVDALVRVVAHVVGRPDMGRIVPADVDAPPAAVDVVEHRLRRRGRRRI